MSLPQSDMFFPVIYAPESLLFLSLSVASQNVSECEPDCSAACFDIEYDTKVSYSKFPNVAFTRQLKYFHNYSKSIDYQR